MRRPTFKLMILPTAVGVSASLMSFAAFFGWASACYPSQHRSLCPSCRQGWDFARFAAFVHRELELVQQLQIYGLVKIKEELTLGQAALNKHCLSSAKTAITRCREL